MVEDAATGALKPVDFKYLSKQIPELQKFNLVISTVSFNTPIDSSNMQPAIWLKLAKIIESNFKKYDGFVILHGSDTMAYTASALSFIFEKLSKPVILTGSQLPMGKIRTDGKENLITAIEIAAAKIKGKPVVPEVAIYFEYELYRGNRTTKLSAQDFRAFESPNYPLLAKAGVHIEYFHDRIAKPSTKALKVHDKLSNSIAIFKLFPGINKEVVNAILNTKGLKAVLLETFGAGNASTEKWFIESLQQAIKNGILILNVSQCMYGKVEQGRYETSKKLKQIGVVSGNDMTSEAAITKLMFLLGEEKSPTKIKALLMDNLRGETSSTVF